MANRFCIGGTEDHVPLAIGLSRTLTIADLVKELKTSSSQWLKTQAPTLSTFAWQEGYGAFSVSPSPLEALRGYIEKQEEHHRKSSFQDEYRKLLEACSIVFNEQYRWD